MKLRRSSKIKRKMRGSSSGYLSPKRGSLSRNQLSREPLHQTSNCLMSRSMLYPMEVAVTRNFHPLEAVTNLKMAMNLYKPLLHHWRANPQMRAWGQTIPLKERISIESWLRHRRLSRLQTIAWLRRSLVLSKEARQRRLWRGIPWW